MPVTGSHIYNSFQHNKQCRQKSFAVLIDPDKVDDAAVEKLAKLGTEAGVDYFFVGGSLVVNGYLDACIQKLKSFCSIPVVLFPGSPAQISSSADALLYLSLISGRNPELLIGQHVLSAPAVKASGLEIISTGYMVVDGGAPTTVSYISNAAPLPADKSDIAVCTAMAGEMLGMKMIYMDAGSGARQPISTDMISKVAANIAVPLIIGGGIRTPERAYESAAAGADVIVVGNAIEKDSSLVSDISTAVKSAGQRILATV